ncbi:phosphotriesterase [Egicoccus sp. AB-alg2]|uniref:phosphotriesterase family protein n=1 Tax=Egicoccus sp. AB-alg2 TaxID=3242693 RepID=UPI00359ED42E
MTDRVVRTVLGDLPARSLGRTDYHEHLLQVTPLLPGDELDDVDVSAEETARLRDSGFDALVDLTPIGLGRDPTGLAEISRRTGVHVVAATGVHREGHYPDDHPVRRWDVARLSEVFEAEITAGLLVDPFADGPVGTTVRAGVIKVGTDYWRIGAFEAAVLEAAGVAQARTGVAVVCHLELGTAAWEAADALERAGADRRRIVLAHADRNPDPGLHLELIASGVTLGYDGAGRTKYWPDSVLLDCLAVVVEGGGGHGLLLGGDVARRSSFEACGGLPGMAYLGRRFVPRIAVRCGERVVEQLLVENPARVFAVPRRG